MTYQILRCLPRLACIDDQSGLFTGRHAGWTHGSADVGGPTGDQRGPTKGPTRTDGDNPRNRRGPTKASTRADQGTDGDQPRHRRGPTRTNQETNGDRQETDKGPTWDRQGTDEYQPRDQSGHDGPPNGHPWLNLERNTTPYDGWHNSIWPN